VGLSAVVAVLAATSIVSAAPANHMNLGKHAAVATNTLVTDSHTTVQVVNGVVATEIDITTPVKTYIETDTDASYIFSYSLGNSEGVIGRLEMAPSDFFFGDIDTAAITTTGTPLSTATDTITETTATDTITETTNIIDTYITTETTSSTVTDTTTGITFVTDTDAITGTTLVAYITSTIGTLLVTITATTTGITNVLESMTTTGTSIVTETDTTTISTIYTAAEITSDTISVTETDASTATTLRTMFSTNSIQVDVEIQLPYFTSTIIE
jgi:hypothetical protein